jgi:TatA/E family protein of Tat protein translocase
VFGIGMSEMIIILAVALLVFGPQQLPEIAKSIAKGLKELRRAGDDLRSSVNFNLDDDKPKQRPHPVPKVEKHPRTPPLEPPPAIVGSELTSALEASEGEPHADDEPWPKPAEGTAARVPGGGEADGPKVH